MYEPRTYRHWIKGIGLACYSVTDRETDLQVCTRTELIEETAHSIRLHRSRIEHYIEQHPSFLTSLEPLPFDASAPAIVQTMMQAAQTAQVGPMAAVAGAVAEAVGKDLLALSPEVIIENGGDIFIHSLTTRNIGIYAGKSPFSGKIALEIVADDTPCGICTSSGTVGHSLSFGKADAVIVLAASAALADAAATAICNRVKKTSDIEPQLEHSQKIEGLKGIVIILGARIGVWGGVKLVEMQA